MKKTIVQSARQRIEDSRQNLMDILKMDELTHNEMLFEHGLLFLVSVVVEKGDSFRLISRHRMYWNWFRNEWSIATDRWIKMYMTLKNIDNNRARNSYRLFMKRYFLEEDIENAALPSFDNFLKAVSK